MTKGTISIQIKCAKCGSTIMEVPDDTADDPIVLCANNHVIGPLSSLLAAIQRDPHTAINAFFTEAAFVPLKTSN